MLIFFFFLIVLASSSSSWRRRYHSQIKSEDLKMAPRISVQPAQSSSVRRFFDGQVTLLNVSSSEGAMLLIQQRSHSSQSGFLKSSDSIKFESTLMTVAQNGDLQIHASTEAQRELIVFKYRFEKPS